MRNEFTAIVEQDEDWFIAYSPEIPGANGQGRTKEAALQNLAEAISLVLEDRREEENLPRSFGSGDWTVEISALSYGQAAFCPGS